MSRRNIREIVLQTLYSLEFQPEKDALAVLQEVQGELSYPEGETAFAQKLLLGVLGNKEAIDKEIGELAKGWPTERMAAVDRNLLRLAVAEMYYIGERTPAAVAINEAVELAKLYGSDESSGFVNGILGQYVRNHEG